MGSKDSGVRYGDVDAVSACAYAYAMLDGQERKNGKDEVVGQIQHGSFAATCRRRPQQLTNQHRLGGLDRFSRSLANAVLSKGNRQQAWRGVLSELNFTVRQDRSIPFHSIPVPTDHTCRPCARVGLEQGTRRIRL